MAVAVDVHRLLARSISGIENAHAPLEEMLARFEGVPNPRTGDAYVIGITGPPGAGKSTVVDRLIEAFRTRGATVAVIAVDPSSPFSGGAVLGDRVRMQRHAGDSGVFIRSMASREAGGGLAPAAAGAVALCDRAGFDVVIVETVGVGQVELEIVSVADIVVVVTVPGLGDGVQTIKAGLTEIADVFIVNMADRPGASQTAADLTHMVRESGRDVPVIKTTAIDGSGIDDVMGHLGAARIPGERRIARSVRFAVVRTVRDAAVREALRALDSSEAAAVFARLEARRLSRTQAVRDLVALVRGAHHHAD